MPAPLKPLQKKRTTAEASLSTSNVFATTKKASWTSRAVCEQRPLAVFMLWHAQNAEVLVLSLSTCFCSWMPSPYFFAFGSSKSRSLAICLLALLAHAQNRIGGLSSFVLDVLNQGTLQSCLYTELMLELFNVVFLKNTTHPLLDSKFLHTELYDSPASTTQWQRSPVYKCILKTSASIVRNAAKPCKNCYLRCCHPEACGAWIMGGNQERHIYIYIYILYIYKYIYMYTYLFICMCVYSSFEIPPCGVDFRLVKSWLRVGEFRVSLGWEHFC